MPRGTLGFAGVTAMDVSAGRSTVSVVFPTTLPTGQAPAAGIAEMVVVPVATVVARPVALTVAAVVSDEAQVTAAVRSWVELLENVPVAVNCCVRPSGTLGFGGATAMEVRVTQALA